VAALRVTGGRRTAFRGGGRTTSNGRASVASDRSLLSAQQGDSEHRDTQRDAKQIRAIHLSNLQLTGTVALRNPHSRRHCFPASRLGRLPAGKYSSILH
jgi:hypothetical protein